MTALEIAQNVAASIGFGIPSTLRSNAEPNARLMLTLLDQGVPGDGIQAGRVRRVLG